MFLLQGRSEEPLPDDIVPFDAASEVAIEEQKVDWTITD